MSIYIFTVRRARLDNKSKYVGMIPKLFSNLREEKMNTSISPYLLNTTFTYKKRRVNMCECVKTYKPNMTMKFQR